MCDRKGPVPARFLAAELGKTCYKIVCMALNLDLVILKVLIASYTSFGLLEHSSQSAI